MTVQQKAAAIAAICQIISTDTEKGGPLLESQASLREILDDVFTVFTGGPTVELHGWEPGEPIEDAIRRLVK